ncbi:MAG: SDR family NAD(P)-dependent oxidoreductase, partial [Polyangiaceae bacterium]
MTPERKVLVVGATGRLGTAIARALALRGDRVVLTARDPSRLEALAEEVGPRPGVRAPFLCADLADDRGPDTLV